MASHDPAIFVSEPLLTPQFVQYRILSPLLQRLSSNFDVTLASPAVAPDVRSRLESNGIRVVSAGARMPPLRHSHDEVPSYIASWGRDALVGLNRRDLLRETAGLPGAHVNMSMTTAIESDIWWMQGRPLDTALPAIAPSLSRKLQVVAAVARGPLGLVDARHFRRAAALSRGIYSNGRANALWFRERGVDVRGVVPSFYSATSFRPTTERPSRDYILAYLGKETDTSALELLMGLDFPIKLFGAKSAGWVAKSVRSRASERVEFLGRVSDEELARLYSHALFTAFPFTEEPFGLIPVESMACGTPVLTYRWQGPGETVLDGRTGWLVSSASQFLVKANEVCERRYPASISESCRRRAAEFHVDHVAALWKALLQAHLAGEPDPLECRIPSGSVARNPSPSRAGGDGHGVASVGPSP